MVFWLAVLVGALFAWIAVQIGFYATWILLFNLGLSIYMAIFLTPVVISNIPAVTAIPYYGYALTLVSIAIASLFVTYGTCYACLSGRLQFEFPKVFDRPVAGVLGFLTGFLAGSFVAFVFWLTPLAQFEFCKTFGLDAPSPKTEKTNFNIRFICWWCDKFNSWVSASDWEARRTGEQQVHALLIAAGVIPDDRPKPEMPVEPVKPATSPEPAKPAPPATDETAKPPAAETPPPGTAPKAETNPTPRSGVNEVPKPEPSPAPAKSGAEATSPPERQQRVETPTETKAAAADPPPATPQGPLSGLWENDLGAQFRIVDDGKTAIVSLVRSDKLLSLSGKLNRPEGKPESKALLGTISATFLIDAPKQYSVHMTATIRDPRHLFINCYDFPVFNKNGKMLGPRPMTETWTHLNEPPPDPDSEENPFRVPRP